MQKEDLILQALEELREGQKSFRSEVNKRFEQVNKRFDRFQKENREDHKELMQKIERERDRLDEIYHSRDKVKITFGWQWAMVSCFIAMIAATFARNFS